MLDELARKFRIVADIIQSVQSNKTDVMTIKNYISAGGLVKKTEIESLIMLAVELGFLLQDNNGKLSVTGEGASFEAYVTSMSLKKSKWVEQLQKPTVLRICTTLIPSWKQTFAASFGDQIEPITKGQKRVAEDAIAKFYVVSPFIDVSVLQMCLDNYYSKDVEITIITSEEKLAKNYGNNPNYLREKLRGLIQSRFKGGRVFYFKNEQSMIHAKIWCSERSVFISSANMESNSITDNVEYGIYADDSEVVATTLAFIEKLAKMNEMRCILQVS